MHDNRKCPTSSRGPDSRANSIIMSFALTVAFGIGTLDPINQMVLEVQMFMPLVTMICLPAVLDCCPMAAEFSRDRARERFEFYTISGLPDVLCSGSVW